MTGFTHDLRFAGRTLRKHKAFTIVAALALAVGIGGSTVMYSAVDGVLLRPLPYPEADRMVRLWETWIGGSGSVSWPNFQDWKDQSHTLEKLTALDTSNYSLARSGGEAERVGGAHVSADFFALVGVQPALGRGFSPESYVKENEVILSYELWQKTFNAAKDVLGQPLRLSGKTFSIVGVLPRGFRLPFFSGGVYVPLNPTPHGSRGSHFLQVLGRLAPGTTAQQAAAEMKQIAAGLTAAYPDSNKDRGVLVRLWHESITEGLRPKILLLFGAVLLVLIIACANVANMLIARAASREGELAVRFALGASRTRVVRQLLTECLVLAVIGGGAGLLLAVWGVEACRAILPENAIFSVGLDGRALLFSGAIALASVLVFGLVPALRAAQDNVASVLKEGGRTVARSRSRLRSCLVVVQVALSFTLLVGAALLGRSFMRLAAVDPGFDPGGVVTVELSLPSSRDPLLFYPRVLERVQALPEVASAGLVDFLPLSQSNMNGGFHIEGKEIDANNETTEYMTTTPDYFATMRMAVVRGRPITAADGKETERVCVINQTMAKKYFGDEDPVGKHVTLQWSDDEPWMTVVGVVGDVKRFGLDGKPAAETWLPFAQQPWPQMSLAVRGKGDPGALAGIIRREVAAVDPEQAVFNVTTMAATLDDSLRQRRLLLDFTGVFGGLALLLAAVGLYGVLAVQVAQRTHELGIRMALGARPQDVRALVLKNALLLSLAGTIVGVAGALILSTVLGKLLYGVDATDPPTYFAVGAALLIVSSLAAWIPARRATRIDPMVALRAS